MASIYDTLDGIGVGSSTVSTQNLQPSINSIADTLDKIKSIDVSSQMSGLSPDAMKAATAATAAANPGNIIIGAQNPDGTQYQSYVQSAEKPDWGKTGTYNKGTSTVYDVQRWDPNAGKYVTITLDNSTNQPYQERTIQGTSGTQGTTETGDYGASTDQSYQMLQQLAQQQEQMFQDRKKAIEQQAEADKVKKEGQQASESGYAGMQLARLGALGTTGSGLAYAQSLDITHRNELQVLEAQKTQLLIEAEKAYISGKADIARSLADRANQLEQNFNNAMANRRANLQTAMDVQKYNKLNMDEAMSAMAMDGKEPPKGWIEAEAQAAGISADAGYSLFNAAKITADMNKTKIAADKQTLAIQSASAINKALNQIPYGQVVTIGGNQYFGTDLGKVEIDENGFGRMMTVDQATGKINVQNLGKIGKVDTKNQTFEIMYGKDGTAYAFNKNTGSITPIQNAQNNWQQTLPEGAIGGQCGRFVNQLTGVGVGDTLASKKAIIDSSITPQNVQVGDVFVQKTNSPTGHVGIVEGVYTDPKTGKPMISIMESNYNLDEKITHGRTMLADDPRLLGFSRPKVLSPMLMSGSDASNVGTLMTPTEYQKFQKEQPVPTNIPSFEEFAKNIEKESLKDPNATYFDVKKAKAIYDQTFGAIPAMSDAINNMVDSSKLSVTSQGNLKKNFQTMIEKGDISGAKDKLKKVAMDTADATTQQQVRGRDSSIRALTQLKSDLAEYTRSGGNTNIFAGTIENIANKVGAVKDEKRRALATRIKGAIIDYRHAVSGAAFTESEAAEYKSMFPDIINTQQLNYANIDALLQMFGQSNESFYRQQIGNDNYDAIFAK